MELSDYYLTFVHIKGNDNILADAISRLNMLDIYMEPIENRKTGTPNNTEKCITEVVPNNVHTLHTDTLHAEEKVDIKCRNYISHITKTETASTQS